MIRFILALLKFTFRWVIPLIGLAALIGFPLLLLNINQCIRTEAVRTLQHYFPNAVLKLESAEFSPGQGIRIRGLQLKIPERSFLRNSQITVLPGEVVMPSRKGDNYDFLFIEEVFFSSPTNWLGLVCCGFQPETVHLRNADIVLHSVDKTHWNWQFLEFVNPKKNKPTLIKELVFEDVDCQIRDYRKEGAVYELRDIGGKLLLQNDKSYELTGTMTGDYAKAMEFSGKVCPLEKRWHIEGNILECEVSPRLIKVLPMECTPQSEFFDNITKNGVLKNIQGVLSLNYSIVYDSAPKEGNKLKFNVNGTLHHGRWDWEGLPDSLSELESQFEANESGIYVKSYNGKIGGGNIAASFRQWTFTSNAPKNVKMRLDNIELNPRMEILLPEKIRPIWRMIQPQGVLNSNIELQFDGTKWIPKINVECKKGGLLFEKFPFKLEDVFGSIQWDRDMLQLTLSDGKHIAFGANFVFPATGLAGHFRLKAQNMPVNEKLIKACPEIAQSIINDFDPKGTVNVEFGMDFPGNKQPAGKFLNITLLNCSGRYAKFPYPLRNVNGILEMKDDFWTFKNLSCNNTPSAITGSGSLNLNPTENKDFLLSLKLTDLPLDKTLAAAMPEDNARLLEGLGASGSIDAQVEVFMRIEKSAKPEIKIHAVPIGNQMSVRAASLPYRLDNVSGNIEFQNDHP